MIALRVFSEEGIEKFREYLQSLKNNPQTARPDLSSILYSHQFLPPVQIDETKSFSTRMEMGAYLTDHFGAAGVDRRTVLNRHDMWTWLAYIWFDQLCPCINGMRKVRETAKYICSSDYTDYYRHYVAVSYDIYSFHGPQNSRLFLSCSAHVHNDFVEQLASRQYIISSRNLIEVVHHLYWDTGRGRMKTGATDRNRRGNIRRLVKNIGQLELTYDIYSMTVDETMSLFSEEFNDWKKPSP